MLREFVTAVHRMATAGKWDEMNVFFALVRQLLAMPILDIQVGEPKDKDL